MTFLQVVNIIRDTALAQPNVNTVVREFLDLNREDTKYSAVVIQDRDGLRDRIVEQDWNTYTFHLGYVDRLTFDEKNRDDIFSTGINVINNIVASIRERWDLEVSIIDRFSTFNQRFTASCAGVYVVLAIQVPISDCVDTEDTDIYDSFDVKITENGHYHFVPDGRPVDEIDITIDVPGQKEEEYLQETIYTNGRYNFSPSEGKVFSEADITVDVPGPKEEQSLVEEVSENGHFEWHPDPGKVFSDTEIFVDVHPSERFEGQYTSNGSYNISGEFDGGLVTVAVPSDQKPEQVGSFEVTEWGTTYRFDPDPGYVFSAVEIMNATPTRTYTSTVASNGRLRWSAVEGGSLVSSIDISVDVHPSQSLVETITSNGSYHYSGDYAGAAITVAVSAMKPEERLVETISSNGSYHYNPSAGSVFSGVDITVSCPVPKTETTGSLTVSANGSGTLTPAAGSVFSGVNYNVDVHPSASLSKTYTTNGTKTITGEFNGGTVNVNVHPSASLVETITSNGSYNYPGEYAGAAITVAVERYANTLRISQTAYNNLSVKDPDTIYLIYY